MLTKSGPWSSWKNVNWVVTVPSMVVGLAGLASTAPSDGALPSSAAALGCCCAWSNADGLMSASSGAAAAPGCCCRCCCCTICWCCSLDSSISSTKIMHTKKKYSTLPTHTTKARKKTGVMTGAAHTERQWLHVDVRCCIFFFVIDIFHWTNIKRTIIPSNLHRQPRIFGRITSFLRPVSASSGVSSAPHCSFYRRARNSSTIIRATNENLSKNKNQSRRRRVWE